MEMPAQVLNVKTGSAGNVQRKSSPICNGGEENK